MKTHAMVSGVDDVIGNIDVEFESFKTQYSIISEYHELASFKKLYMSWTDKYELTVHDNEHRDRVIAISTAITLNVLKIKMRNQGAS